MQKYVQGIKKHKQTQKTFFFRHTQTQLTLTKKNKLNNINVMTLMMLKK